jgi:hypothetical protein
MLCGEGIADEFIRIVDDYVAKRFGEGLSLSKVAALHDIERVLIQKPLRNFWEHALRRRRRRRIHPHRR